MTTRTDIHRATQDFRPEDYITVGYYYTGEREFLLPGYLNPAYSHMQALIATVAASTTTAYHSGHQCDHCGAHISYVVVVQHQPTGDHLAIGETCAAGRFQYDPAELERLHQEAARSRQERKQAEAWETYMATHLVDWATLHASTNPFIVDVLRRGRVFGSLSDRQLAAISAAALRDAERQASRAEREAAEALEPKMLAPEGRATVRGEVVFTQIRRGDYGATLKMLVKCSGAEGTFKVWSTVPASIDARPANGDAVEFTATFTRSADDPFFAFAKRPTNGRVLEAAGV